MPTLIDTREAFRRLREQGGFTDEQADAIVDLFRDADEEVATRSDIEELDERLTQRIDLSEERLGQKIEQVRTRLTQTVVSSVAAAGAVLAAIIALAVYMMG